MTKYNATIEYRHTQTGTPFFVKLPNMTAEQVTVLQRTVGTRTGGVEVVFLRAHPVKD